MGERSSLKRLGLKVGGSFPPHPLPLLSQPRDAPSLAHFSFTCLISAPPEKGKESAATEAKQKYQVTSVGVEKTKSSRLLVKHIKEFKMKEIQRMTPQ